MLYQRSYSHRNKTVVLQPRKLQEVYVVPEVILPQKQNRGIIAKKTTGSLCCNRGHTPTETKPWYYSQENYRKSMLYQRSYFHRNKTVVLQPRKLQEVYVVQEVIQKQNRGIIAKKTTGSLCCTRGHTPTETKPWYYSQENYRKSMLYQRSYSYRNKTVVLQPRKLQEVYVVPEVILPGNKTVVLQPRKLQEVYVVPEVILHRNKTVVLQPRKLQEVYVVPEVILPQKQNRGIIAKKTTGSLSCTRGHTPTETKPWYYSQENYRKSMLYQRSYSHRNKTVVLQPRKLQEVYVVQRSYPAQKQNRGIIAKKTTGSLCCSRGHTPTETKPWYYSQENYRKSMLYQRSYSHRNKTVVLQPRKLQEVYVVQEVILHTETKPWYYSQENYRKSSCTRGLCYTRGHTHTHRNKTVVLQPGKLQEVYVVAEVILLQKQNRGIIAKKTTGSLSCTRGHTPTETKPWYYSQERYRKSKLYQRSYSTETKPWYYSKENYRKSVLQQRSYFHRNKTVVLQPRKLQEVYVVPEVILPQKQNRAWYYSQENYRKSKLYQRSYSHRNKTVVLQPRKLQEVYVVPEVILHRNKTVVLQPRKLQEVYVVPEVILPQKQNRGIIAKKTTGSLCCTRGHTPTETKPWYYSQENYRKSKLYKRSYSHRNKTVVLQPRKLQEVYVVPEVILLQKQNRGIIARKTTGSLSCTRGHTPTETKPWYYSKHRYRKSSCTRGHTSTETKPWYYSQENYSLLYQRSYSYRNKTVVLQPRKLQEVYTRGHTPTETKPWYYSQENYRKSMLYQRSYSYRNKTVVLQPRKLQEVYVVPEVILPQKQNRGIIAKTTGSLVVQDIPNRNKTVVLQPRKLQEVYVVPEVILPQKQNRGIIAKKTTGSLCCTRGHTPTETKPWYYSQENYRKSKLYQRSYSHRNKTVVLQPRKLQEVYVVPEVILPQKQNRGIIAKKTTGSLCCTRGHTPTETKPWYYSQENYRKSMLYQRSYSHRNKTVVLQPRKLQEV